MSDPTAIPIVAVPLAATTKGVAARLPAAHGKAGMEQAAAPPGTAKPAGDQNVGSAEPPVAGGESFAAVLGRQLAKDIGDPNDLPGTTVVSLAAAPTDAAALPADQREKKADEKLSGGEDGAAVGIANLLPLLQSLLCGTAAPRLDAECDTKIDLKINTRSDTKVDVKINAKSDPQHDPTINAKSDDARQEVLGLQGAPLRAEAEADEPPGESRTAQPQEALAATEAKTGTKNAAAIPAASPLDAKITGNRSESADAPGASFAGLLASTQVPATQGPVSRARTPLAVETPVGSRNWDSNVGEKLVWMVGHKEQRADLILNPPQLGKVEVSISVHGDQANAQFVSADPAVRDALEAAMPRLREMLADAGLNLGQAQVGSGSAQNAAGNSANNQENGDNSRRGSSVAGQVGALGQVGAAGAWLRTGTGMVDVFA